MIPPIFLIVGIGGAKIFLFFRHLFPARLLIAGSLFLGSILVFEIYYSYFLDWGSRQETFDAFNFDYVEAGKILNALPAAQPKYVYVEAQGVLVRGIPMPTQTIMFLTDTFTPEKQIAKKLFYVLPNNSIPFPPNSFIIDLK